MPEHHPAIAAPTPVAIAAVVSLTPRERQILRQIAEGRSAKEIAKGLTIAPRTVERHIDHIRLKTRTRNRSHLIAYALLLGMLGDD